MRRTENGLYKQLAMPGRDRNCYEARDGCHGARAEVRIQRVVHQRARSATNRKLAPDWHQRSPQNKKVSGRLPADFGVSWLPDLGSNQGPTD